jgi:hypothetical protein
MPGSVLRSERLVVAIETATDLRKLFQVQFSNSDGSLFVSFPYFAGSPGLVSVVNWPATGSSSATVSLEPGGKVSSHLVKYSHHPSGRAHFSQDGRVRTEIKKQSVPLADVEGHIFSLHIHGLHGFDKASGRDRASGVSVERTLVRFRLEDPLPGSIKFVGRLHSSAWLQARANDGMVVPTMQLSQPDGSLRPAFVWSSPIGTPSQERCLVVSIELQPQLDQTRVTSLLFVGGFDSSEAMDDLSKPVSFLALSYPVENVDQLRARLGSIDFGAPNDGARRRAT